MTKRVEKMEIVLSADDALIAQCVLQEPGETDAQIHAKERNLLELTNVYVSPAYRGLGYSKAVLRAAILIIDGQRCDAMLRVRAHPRGRSVGLTVAELTALYRVFGFKTTKLDKGVMVRRCRVKSSE